MVRWPAGGGNPPAGSPVPASDKARYKVPFSNNFRNRTRLLHRVLVDNKAKGGGASSSSVARRGIQLIALFRMGLAESVWGQNELIFGQYSSCSFINVL